VIDEVPFSAWTAFCRSYRQKEGGVPDEHDRFHRQLFQYFAAGWKAGQATPLSPGATQGTTDPNTSDPAPCGDGTAPGSPSQ
jgi:hypothetical protein